MTESPQVEDKSLVNREDSQLVTSSVPRPRGEAAQTELGIVDTSFYLVGIGASAGGLEAIKALISQIPPNCPHSFVCIQHISPDYKSLMGELLQRETALRVCEVEDDMPIESGHIYIIPPKVNVIIRGTDPVTNRSNIAEFQEAAMARAVDRGNIGLSFALVRQMPRPQLNLPIDLFFQSLAEAVGDRAVAVVLSGTGSDGSRGLRAVKDVDGIVLAQDPKTAAFDGMPSAAIATRIVDLVLPPDEMVRELFRYFDMRESGVVNVNTLFEESRDALGDILNAAGEEASIDFTQYKEPTLKRRIARRMGIKRCATLEDYLNHIRQDSSELAILCREFLVGVTHFFRDLPAWESLREEVFPKLFENPTSSEPLKIWSVGCSTGEEAYTIAMMLEAYRQEHGIERDFRVFATDVNQTAIGIAKEGVYPEGALEDIPAIYAREFVSYSRGGVSIAESIRKRTIFSVHNVVESPPYIYTDLLICRNMLIYITPSVQAQVLSIFSYSLLASRYLFLGASESVERGYSRFEPIDNRWRIFRNVSKTRSRDAGGSRLPSNHRPPVRTTSLRLNNRGNGHQKVIDSELLKSILTGLDSCAIVVDDRLQIMETHGDYRRHLCLPDEGFSAHLLDLVPERLSHTLSLLIRKADKANSASHGPIKIDENESKNSLQIYCQKHAYENNSVAFILILRQIADTETSQLGPVGRSEDNPANRNSVEQSRYVMELEAELATTRETLETTVEDLGISNEELQTSNEELMSANEELQSTNEELQSVNEELHTINAEHAAKIAELETAYADIDNLLNNTDLATVFLDSRLRIRRFSHSIREHFQLDHNDIGRPLAHFSSTLELQANKQLLADAEKALSDGTSRIYEVASVNGNWYLARVHPFSTTAGETTGAVLTFVDISSVKKLQEESRMRMVLLEGVLESEAAGYWDWDIANGVEFMSPRFKQMFGYENDELENVPESWMKITHPDDLPKIQENFKAHAASHGEVPYDNEVRYFHKDGSVLWVLRRGKVIDWNDDGSPRRMVGCHIDISHLKQREEDTLWRAEEIRRFAYVSAHDLREPMNTIENFVNLLKEELADRLDPDLQPVMKYIIEASGRMNKQIQSILDYAKLQDRTLQFEIIDMGDLVQRCVEDLQSSIAKVGGNIVVDDLPQAAGSPALIARVFQNLISNALKFHNPNRRPAISITGFNHGSQMSIFQVSDNGIGIEKKYREKVFEIFSRLHSNADYEGTGFGLALSRKIVMQHGGKIWIEDGDDGGTTVVFTLKKSAE